MFTGDPYKRTESIGECKKALFGKNFNFSAKKPKVKPKIKGLLGTETFIRMTFSKMTLSIMTDTVERL